MRRKSGEQHCKSRALVLVIPTNSQFTADLFDKSSNDPHSQSFAGGGIESFRQACAIIGNRQRVAFFTIGFQADRDPACTVFRGVGDQFVGDEAERNGGDGRQSDFDSLDEMSAPGARRTASWRCRDKDRRGIASVQRFARRPMSEDADGCVRSWRCDRLRRPNPKQPRHSSTLEPAAKQACDHLQAVQQPMIRLLA